MGKSLLETLSERDRQALSVQLKLATYLPEYLVRQAGVNPGPGVLLEILGLAFAAFGHQWGKSYQDLEKQLRVQFVVADELERRFGKPDPAVNSPPPSGLPQ